MHDKWYALKKFASFDDMKSEVAILLDLEKRFGALFPRIHRSFKHKGNHSFLMDLYETSLQALHRTSSITEKEVLGYGIEITKQLEKLHSAGYVHCDIKPDNIMCSKDGRATLIDFGLSHKFINAKG